MGYAGHESVRVHTYTHIPGCPVWATTHTPASVRQSHDPLPNAPMLNSPPPPPNCPNKLQGCVVIEALRHWHRSVMESIRQTDRNPPTHLLSLFGSADLPSQLLCTCRLCAQLGRQAGQLLPRLCQFCLCCLSLAVGLFSLELLAAQRNNLHGKRNRERDTGNGTGDATGNREWNGAKSTEVDRGEGLGAGQRARNHLEAGKHTSVKSPGSFSSHTDAQPRCVSCEQLGARFQISNHAARHNATEWGAIGCAPSSRPTDTKSSPFCRGRRAPPAASLMPSQPAAGPAGPDSTPAPVRFRGRCGWGAKWGEGRAGEAHASGASDEVGAGR